MPWLAVSLLALAGHAVVLGLVPLGIGDAARGGVPAPMQARRIVLAPPVMEELLPPLATVPVAPLPVAALVATRATAAASAPSAAEPEEPAAAAAPLMLAAAALPAAAEPNAGGGDVPTYPTRIPPGALLQYELRRGALTGHGVLEWRPRADGYGLSLEGTAFALPILSWISRGGFDAAGLAPERFVDKRRSRDVRAANFQRDKGLITFSGPPIAYPLVPGAQDRLSWTVQLGAIIEAKPGRFVPGEHITLFVAGARGDADIWTFHIDSQEGLDLPTSRVERALHLRREPRKPYDAMVEVWLDPARHHMPVRIRLSVPQTGDSTDFSLVQMTFIP